MAPDSRKVGKHDRCRCCFADKTSRDLWAEYKCDGKIEVYGEMLIECFGLPLVEPREYCERICESCVCRLRDAACFRKGVIFTGEHIDKLTEEIDSASEESPDNKLKSLTKAEDDNTKKIKFDIDTLQGQSKEEIKEELVEEVKGIIEAAQNNEDEKEEYYIIQATEEGEITTGDEMKTEYEEEDEEMNYDDSDYLAEERSHASSVGDEYFEVEFLEDDDDAKNAQPTPKSPSDQLGINPFTIKKDGTKGQYRRYTEAQLQAAIDLVQNEGMSCHGAALQCNVPVKTLGLRLRKIKENSPMKYKKYSQTNMQTAVEEVFTHKMTTGEAAVRFGVNQTTLRRKVRELALTRCRDSKDPTHMNYPLIKDIQQILTYTNATPYKTKAGKYYCAYCSTDGPIFETAHKLRLHTRINHASERIQNIERTMRPAWKHEVLKLDILDLKCTVCFADITGWLELFEHLKTHDVTLDEAYVKVIPYALTNELACCLCKQAFAAYTLLDAHMNAHYTNYICGRCGETFLAESRLKKHVDTHKKKARYQCYLCDKVFNQDRYRVKHMKLVHYKSQVFFKCHYCNEHFKGAYERHFHCMQQHPDTIRWTTCEYCGKKFNWRPYYSKHVRLTHMEVPKKHKCEICFKGFYQPHQLKLHYAWHRGETKKECPFCGKKFASLQYLRGHYAKHVENKEATWEGTSLQEGTSAQEEIITDSSGIVKNLPTEVETIAE